MNLILIILFRHKLSKGIVVPISSNTLKRSDPFDLRQYHPILKAYTIQHILNMVLSMIN